MLHEWRDPGGEWMFSICIKESFQPKSVLQKAGAELQRQEECRKASLPLTVCDGAARIQVHIEEQRRYFAIYSLTSRVCQK